MKYDAVSPMMGLGCPAHALVPAITVVQADRDRAARQAAEAAAAEKQAQVLAAQQRAAQEKAARDAADAAKGGPSSAASQDRGVLCASYGIRRQRERWR